MERSQTYEVIAYNSEADYFNGKGILAEIGIETKEEAIAMGITLAKYYYASLVQSDTREYKRVFRESVKHIVS